MPNSRVRRSIVTRPSDPLEKAMRKALRFDSAARRPLRWEMDEAAFRLLAFSPGNNVGLDDDATVAFGFPLRVVDGVPAEPKSGLRFRLVTEPR